MPSSQNTKGGKMNRDKKLLMAFQSFKQRVVVGYPLNLTEDKQDEYDIDTFLASEEYKELEITDEEIRNAAAKYSDYTISQVGFRKGAIWAFKQGGEK